MRIFVRDCNGSRGDAASSGAASSEKFVHKSKKDAVTICQCCCLLEHPEQRSSRSNGCGGGMLTVGNKNLIGEPAN